MIHPDWTNTSLVYHIKEVLPDVAVSEAEVQLLWRCFHFYAYHPFSRDATDAKVDLAAFQRAIASLVVQGTYISGTQDEASYFWRNDDAHFSITNFETVFRSISLPEETDGPSVHLSYESKSILEDAMDVPAVTQSYSICSAPSPDLLRLAVRKLLGETALRRRYRIPRKELSRLPSLHLRLRLGEAKWRWRFHFGTVGKGDSGDELLADILTRGLGGNQDEEHQTFCQTEMAVNLLVSQCPVEPGSSKSHAGCCSLQQFDHLSTNSCSSDHRTAFNHS